MQLTLDRRALHRIPELDDRLPQTMAYLRSALSALPCRLFSPIDGALCAYFDQGRPTTLAFRSDADALPIAEATGLPFASTFAGQMHACGHDGHMAMLLELARRLPVLGRLSHNILLIFQPAEETTGGAKRICESGILNDCHVCAVFGMHLWPDLPAGVIASRKNEMMSRSCEVTVEIFGRASHIAKAEQGIDALAAGAEFVRRCRELERALPQEVFRLLHFGRMESGTVRNAVSGYTKLEGSLRAFQDDHFALLQQGVRSVASELSAKTGCQFRVKMNEGYPAVMNPPALFSQVQRLAPFETLAAPVMITEDFSYYQQALPAMFFFLGTGGPALHTPEFNFDETILATGADFWTALAKGYQEEPECCQP